MAQAQHNQINNNRILQLMAQIEDKTQKMFHEIDKTLEQACIEALDAKAAAPKIRCIAVLSKQLDQLNEQE